MSRVNASADADADADAFSNARTYADADADAWGAAAATVWDAGAVHLASSWIITNQMARLCTVVEEKRYVMENKDPPLQ